MNEKSKKTILFDRIVLPLELKTARLTVTEIKEGDKEEFAKLYLDDQLNKWWGYDYRADLGNNEPTPDYFFGFYKKLMEIKEEVSFAVKLDGKMIGDLVLHNFDDEWGVEMGFRFFKTAQGKGYAIESASALKEYVKNVLKAKRLKSRCYKENLPSKKLIEKLGLKLVSESQTHYYFACEL